MQQRLGPYVIQRSLAQGGMGAVHVALHEPTGRQVALKVSLGDPSPQERERFVREAQATAQLRHPNIVTVHDAGEIAGRAYLAMELVPGESLKARIERGGPLPSPEAAELLRTLADAMAVAHAAGILHRDLKPANVVMTPEGQPVLVDFGLARRAEDQALTRTGEVLGTPAYMSPEQAAGERARVDGRADVYGLGAILYTVLCGQPPFSGATAINVVTKVLGKMPERPSKVHAGVDPQLEAICMNCLQKEPGERFASALELSRALSRYLDGASAPPRGGVLHAGAALAVILAAAAGGTWAMARGPEVEGPQPVTDALDPSAEEPPQSSELATVVVDRERFAEVTALELEKGWQIAVESRGLRLRSSDKLQEGPALSLPLELGAGSLSVELDVDIDYMEQGNGLVLRLEERGGRGGLALRTSMEERSLRLTLVSTSGQVGEPATWTGTPREPVIELRLALSYDPVTRGVTCRIGTQSIAVLLAESLTAGACDLRLGLVGSGLSGRRNCYSSLWVRRLAVSAPGLVTKVPESLAARLGRAQRQVAAGSVGGREALLALCEQPGVGRAARLALAFADAEGHEEDAVVALQELLREEQGDVSDPAPHELRPVRNLALYYCFALSPRQRRALARAYVVVCKRPRGGDFVPGKLRAIGSEIVRANPGVGRDRWGAAFLAFLAADASEPEAPALDEGRAYVMNGALARGLELLAPLEEGAAASSRGRAGYAAFRLRRFSEAVRWWSPPRLARCQGKLLEHYVRSLEEARRLTSR